MQQSPFLKRKWMKQPDYNSGLTAFAAGVVLLIYAIDSIHAVESIGQLCIEIVRSSLMMDK